MDILGDVNLCKIFFGFISFNVIVVGTLINFFESSFPVFISETVRYGKLSSKNKTFLTKLQELPKSYFRHFYFTAVLIYSVVLFEVFSVYVLGNETSNWVNNLLDLACGSNRLATVSTAHVLIAVILMVLQVFRRFYDTHFVSVFSKNAKINFLHYVLGMVYYPAVALMILSEAPKFASNEIKYTGFQLKDIGIIEIFATVLFLWAWYHQHVTTVILANLRKNKKGEVVSQDYKIPQGDWFNYLSSPHSTAEIIMYTALTVLLHNNTGWWYIYAWILSNQAETILLSHWWYQTHFKNFPRRIKALVPYVY